MRCPSYNGHFQILAQINFFSAYGSDEELLETILYFMLHRSRNILADEPKIHHLGENECQQNSLWTFQCSEN